MPVDTLLEIDRKLHSRYDRPLGDGESVFSGSGENKVGWSVDFPIARTCLGRTPVCSEHCYGVRVGRPQARNLDVLEKHLRVLKFFKETDSAVVARRIVSEYEAKRMQVLRWCGVGDLTIEAVRVINEIAFQHPHIRQWVVSRIPHLLAQVDRDAENTAPMLSTDNSAESARAMEEMARYQHPLVRYAFLRVDPGEPTLGADVVFDVRKGMPSPGSGFVCPADSGRFQEKSGACSRCGWHCARRTLG